MTSWTARLRPLKYRLRCLLLCLSPFSYWSIRGVLKGLKEPEIALVPYLCDREHTSLDLGANFGAYTCLMSRYSRICHAFEPLPMLARTLRTGYRRANVVVHQVALSNCSGHARIRAPRADIGFSTIEPTNVLHGKVIDHSRIDEFEVKTCCLDDYGFDDVGFVKMDVEGHEAAVLHGGRHLFETCRPSILVEIEDRHCPGGAGAVFEFLLPLNYSAYVFVGGALLPCPAPSREAGDGNAGIQSRNVLFLQPEIAQRLARDLSM